MKINLLLSNIKVVLCVMVFASGLWANPKPAKIVEGTENGTSASSQAQAAAFCKNALFNKVLMKCFPRDLDDGDFEANVQRNCEMIGSQHSCSCSVKVKCK